MTTIVDVARRAGVTAATVSNVITGKGSVSAKTRDLVLAVIEELGYRPNLVARGLVRRRTNTLALVVPTIANPFYGEIAEDVEQSIREHGYRLLLCNTHHDATIGREHLENLVSRWVDGLLLMEGSLPLSDILAVSEGGLAVVLCNWEREQQTIALPTVNIDFLAAGELAARHLLELGHRQIGVITEKPFHIQRLEGFCRTLEMARFPVAADYISYGESTLESGYKAAQTLFQLTLRPTAIFATNDLMALGAMEAATDQGLRIPADISIIGLDNILLGTHIRPKLTTVALPKREQATKAIELLLHCIDTANQSPSLHMIPPYLIVRQSTARPSDI